MRKFKRLFIFILILSVQIVAIASVNVNVNGSSYTIPQTNERGWGTAVTSWIQAISSNTLQPVGGSFSLTADADFGASFGLKTAYYKSRSANISSSGIIRLAKTDFLGWRNNANSADLLLGLDASDNLTFNGVLVPTTTAVTLAASQTLTNKTLTNPVISTISNTGTLTLPTSTDTLVGRATTDTLTNKTISGVSNTISNVSLTTGVTGALPILNGGTGQTTKAAGFDALQPMTTGGDLIYGGASGTGTRLPNGSSGQFLKSNGGTAAPSWGNPTIQLLTPNIQTFTTGSGTYGLSYYFFVTSANATVGATYTNNAQTFTVARTISGSTLLLCTSTGAPASSGTLTKSTGTGDATITFSTFQAPLYLKITMVGGGGGGAGTGAGNGAGGNGGITTFGTSLLTANGGTGGSAGTVTPGLGGTALLSTPVIGFAITGSGGNSGGNTTTSGGGAGGASMLGGSGYGGGAVSGAGGTAATNSGSGGGGAGSNATSSGAGGGSGGGILATIYSPNATYTYAVGAGGTSGAGATAGGAGAAGIINVEEFFQ